METVLAKIRGWDDFETLPVLALEDRRAVSTALANVQSFLIRAQPDDISKALAELDVLPRRRDTDAEAKFKHATYVKALADLPKWTLTRAVSELVKSEEWFPVPAQIRKAAEAHLAKAMWRQACLKAWLDRSAENEPIADPATPEDVQRIKAEVAAEIARKRGVCVEELSTETRQMLLGEAV